MNEQRVIKFYKSMGLYNRVLFTNIRKKVTLIPSSNYNSNFYGVYVNLDGDYTLILPKIGNVLDELVWVHEYAHCIFVEYFGDSDEMFPNIMEAYFINKYVDDKTEVINDTIENIKESDCEKHTLAMKLKLSIIK